MKIAIMSDTHDNLANFKKVIAFIKKEKVNLTIHCGDVCFADTLREALKDYKGDFLISKGNGDIENFCFGKLCPKEFAHVKFFEDFGKITANKKKIAFTHMPEKAKKMAESQKYDLVFCGHYHRPWEEKIKKTRFANPGNVAGLYYPPTFALYDTTNDKLELKILNRLKI